MQGHGEKEFKTYLRQKKKEAAKHTFQNFHIWARLNTDLVLYDSAIAVRLNAKITDHYQNQP